MGRYNRDERRHNRDEPGGDRSQSSAQRRRFPWDDPADTDDPAPEWREPPPDPDPPATAAKTRSPTDRQAPPPDPDPPESHPPGEFPWQSAAGGNQPSSAWEEQPPETPMSAGEPGSTATARGVKRNPMAIAGFVCSLVMWIPIPPPATVLNVLLWVMALTFSSIGLGRSRRFGLRYRGLAIAGLCLSLIGVVLLIILAILFAVGISAFWG